MFFGIREKKTELGEFSSEKCRECGCTTFRLVKTVRYFVAFFVNLLPLSVKYESVCGECGAAEAVDRAAASAAAQKEFGAAQRKDVVLTFLRIAAFAVVIAAAVALPLTLIKSPGPDPAALVALAGSEDGAYDILDADGAVLAIVKVENGEKNLTFFDDMSALTGEPGATCGFVMHEYYKQAGDAAQSDPTGADIGGGSVIESLPLERIIDNPGVLEDRYEMPVRSYHYDLANKAMGYSLGISDLTTIQYTPGKVIYPCTYYISDTETQDYTVVLYLKGKTRIEATFASVLTGEMQLSFMNVSNMENGHPTKTDEYYLDVDSAAKSTESGLSPESAMQEISDFIAENELIPIQTTEYEYFNGTGVYKTRFISQPDANGDMQSTTHRFDITEKDGYFIRQEHVS